MSAIEMKKKKVAILGAGIGGLSAGWVLAQKGYDVEIFEKSSYAGGLAVTKSHEGYRYDLGPHNIHTRHRHISSFLSRRFPSLFRHDPTFKIIKNGVFVDYPLRGLKVITSLSKAKLLPAVVSFISARARMFLGQPEDDSSFAAWIRNRFGGILYKEYFHDYPAKVWGLDPDDIDKHVAEKRVPILGLVEMIRAVILKKKPRLDHPEVTDENFYLRKGIGEIPQYLEKRFREAGGRIRFGASPTEVSVGAGSVTGISIRNDGGQIDAIDCDFLLSTIPLNEFVMLFQLPAEVRAAASGIDYCASILLFIKVAREKVLPSTMIYFSEPEILFSRVSDFGAFSREMVPDGHTLLCLELPCTVGDGSWTKNKEEIFSHGLEALIAKDLISKNDVAGYFLEFVSHSYPRFRKGFQSHVDVCGRFLGSCRNVLSYGRQGGFSYVNTDSVMHLGFNAADAVVMAEAMGYSCSEWFKAHTSA